MLLHLVLYYLSIALLNSLKVGLCLSKLVFPVQDQGLCALNFLFDISHYLRYYVDLVWGQIHFVYALSTQERVLELICLASSYSGHKIRMNQLAWVSWATWVWHHTCGWIHLNELIFLLLLSMHFKLILLPLVLRPLFLLTLMGAILTIWLWVHGIERFTTWLFVRFLRPVVVLVSLWIIDRIILFWAYILSKSLFGISKLTFFQLLSILKFLLIVFKILSILLLIDCSLFLLLLIFLF